MRAFLETTEETSEWRHLLSDPQVLQQTSRAYGEWQEYPQAAQGQQQLEWQHVQVLPAPEQQLPMNFEWQPPYSPEHEQPFGHHDEGVQPTTGPELTFIHENPGEDTAYDSYVEHPPQTIEDGDPNLAPLPGDDPMLGHEVPPVSLFMRFQFSQEYVYLRTSRKF